MLKNATFQNHKKNESFKLGIDKETNLPKSIENVARGLKCNVKCSECGADFIAAKGEKNANHFRHSVESDCKGGQETALHKLAKEIICKNLDLQVTQKARIQYSNPVAEINQDEFRPDITAKYGEEVLYFEVVVSNPVSPKKANKYINNEIKTIVIDLSIYEYQTESELEEYILENTSCKTVLFWTKKESISFWELLKVLGAIGLFLFGIYKLIGTGKNNKPLNKWGNKPKLKQRK